MNAYLT